MSYRLAESNWFYKTGDGYKIHPTCTMGLRHTRLYDRIETLDEALKRLARKKSTVKFERYPHFEGWSVREYRLEDAETGEIIEYAGMLVDGLAEARGWKKVLYKYNYYYALHEPQPFYVPGPDGGYEQIPGYFSLALKSRTSMQPSGNADAYVIRFNDLEDLDTAAEIIETGKEIDTPDY